MYRVKKANGWNRYKVQVRVLLFFWSDVKCMNFHSKDAAKVCAFILNEGGNIA